MMQDEKFYKSVGRWGVLHFGRKYAIHERRPVGSSPPLFLRKNQFLAALVSSKRSNRLYAGRQSEINLQKCINLAFVTREYGSNFSSMPATPFF